MSHYDVHSPKTGTYICHKISIQIYFTGHAEGAIIRQAFGFTEIDIVEYAISEMESIVNQIDRVNARLRETTTDGSGKDPQ